MPVPGPSAVIGGPLGRRRPPRTGSCSTGSSPVKPGRRLNRLRDLRALETTVVCYKSPAHRVLATLEAIGAGLGRGRRWCWPGS